MPTTRDTVLDTLTQENVHFLRLQFTDILGTSKNVEVPTSQFHKAVHGKIMFDGSSIEGFVRIEESDMYLKPDLGTLQIFPWQEHHSGPVARLICDVEDSDGQPFAGCPRGVLQRQVQRAESMGFSTAFGPEAEFFLFETDSNGEPTLTTHDNAGYFDLTPADRGEKCRRDIVNTLERMGFEVEAAHHEVAPGQHEIDFKYADAITTADNLITFKLIVRKIASDHGLHATFMPKPIFGENGSGMHANQSLFRGSENAFATPEGALSNTALQYIGGILEHARSFCAITNPLVNSYKRLVPGFEAPVTVAWSEKNRSAMIRIPASRGNGTRMELRMPDPACNPYLALAVMLGSGLNGIERGLTPPAPVTHNLFAASDEKQDVLPANLGDGIRALQQSESIKVILGEHVFNKFIEAKTREWQNYIQQVHTWELDTYLNRY